MFKEYEKKYKDIMNAIPDLEKEQCIILGIMGMARTMELVKYISVHKQKPGRVAK